MKIAELLKNVLDIIEFDEDRDSFVESFIMIINKFATISLYEKLTDTQKKEITAELGEEGLDGEKANQIIKKYFTQEDINNSVSREAAFLLDEFFTDILPGLSEDKKEALLKFEKENFTAAK